MCHHRRLLFHMQHKHPFVTHSESTQVRLPVIFQHERHSVFDDLGNCEWLPAVPHLRRERKNMICLWEKWLAVDDVKNRKGSHRCREHSRNRSCPHWEQNGCHHAWEYWLILLASSSVTVDRLWSELSACIWHDWLAESLWSISTHGHVTANNILNIFIKSIICWT